MSYPDLSQISDPALRQALKHLCDRLNAQETLRRAAPVLPLPANTVDWSKQGLQNIAAPVQNQDGITQQFLATQLQTALNEAASIGRAAAASRSTRTGAGPGGGNIPPPDQPPGPGTLICHTDLAKAQGAIPGRPNLRWHRGNFIGFRVQGLPNVPQGCSDPTVLSTMQLDRYSSANQATILAAYAGAGYTHFVLSWPDSRDGNGQSIGQFVATATSVQAAGLYPVIFLLSKDYDGQNADATKNAGVMAALNAAGVAPIYVVGWELNEIYGDGTQLQPAIDFTVANRGSAIVYVHFSPGVPFWGVPGDTGATFWGKNVGKLTGLLHQKITAQDCGMYQARLNDIQVRFNGAAGWPADSGLGHPFDVVAFECSASQQFFDGMSQRDGDTIGFQALCTPGPIPIYGYGNGATGNP